MNGLWLILSLVKYELILDHCRLVAFGGPHNSVGNTIDSTSMVSISKTTSLYPFTFRQHGENSYVVYGWEDMAHAEFLVNNVSVSIRIHTEKCFNHHEHFSVLSASSPTDMTWIQRVGLSSEIKTTSFISANFDNSSRDSFLSDARRASAILQQNEPWSRYYSIMNFNAIYSAHVPGTSTDLECKYGDPQRKMLACNPTKVLQIAAASPSSDLFVVLVNAGEYGGTGNRGLAIVSTKHTYLDLLLLHEIAHSHAGVSDEYTYGFSESKDISLKNCVSPIANKTPWEGWIKIGAIGSRVRGCSYDNYFRPTDNTCVMGNPNVRSYCPVCREAIVTSFFSSKRDLSAPRCPSEQEIIQLGLNQSTVLHAGLAFENLPDITILWNITANEKQTGLSSVTITGRMFGIGLHKINVTIIDSTKWVLPENRNQFMTFVTSFTVNVSIYPDLCQNATNKKSCSVRDDVATSYCSVCRGPCQINETLFTKLDKKS
eukprot:PhF_6_TR32127/c0_g1_i1/m.47559